MQRDTQRFTEFGSFANGQICVYRWSQLRGEGVTAVINFDKKISVFAFNLELPFEFIN
jgi:hypothetical protein